jgi:hypothetical protein
VPQIGSKQANKRRGVVWFGPQINNDDNFGALFTYKLLVGASSGTAEDLQTISHPSSAVEPEQCPQCPGAARRSHRGGPKTPGQQQQQSGLSQQR